MDIREGIQMILTVVLATVIILGVCFGVVYWMEKNTCYAKYEECQPEFSVFGGCKIMVEGKRIPADLMWIELIGKE